MEKWKKEPGFSEVMEFIESVIYEQKFQLAANGVINAAFIAKDLGVDQPTQINVSANADSSAAISEVGADEVREAVRDILAEI